MTDRNLVNFFIVGAPKCGSTTLFHALPKHPNITFGRSKEPHAFIGNLKLRGTTSMSAYEEMYDFDCGAKIFGDASVMHLYSPDAAKNIARYNPDAKILIMLREPDEFIVSYHHEQVYNGVERDLSLRACWDLSQERREGRKLPQGCPDKRLLDYKKIALFDVQVQRFLNVFEENQLRIGCLSDFQNRPELFLKNLFNFLEVQYCTDLQLDHYAAAKTYKNPTAHKVVALMTNPKVLSVWKQTRRMLGISGRFNLVSRIKKANTVAGKKTKISADLRDEIRLHYKESNERLHELRTRLMLVK